MRVHEAIILVAASSLIAAFLASVTTSAWMSGQDRLHEPEALSGHEEYTHGTVVAQEVILIDKDNRNIHMRLSPSGFALWHQDHSHPLKPMSMSAASAAFRVVEGGEAKLSFYDPNDQSGIWRRSVVLDFGSLEFLAE